LPLEDAGAGSDGAVLALTITHGLTAYDAKSKLSQHLNRRIPKQKGLGSRKSKWATPQGRLHACRGEISLGIRGLALSVFGAPERLGSASAGLSSEARA
jgi:hypothetical protein